jgi:hypothetical protein
VSGDLESLLRSEMTHRVDAAPPTVDDPGLADLAIAGAGRIRRRRRVGAAVSGAGLLVLGAGVFVWQPWVAPDPDGDLVASDTSATEAQVELDMEFVVRGEDGAYGVLNDAGETLPLGEEDPLGVYRLADAYMADNDETVSLTSLDGDDSTTYEKPSLETYTRINSGGTQFAMVSPNDDFTAEDYLLRNVTFGSAGEEVATFATDYALSLEDWSESTAFFSGDLHSTTGGNAGSYLFEEDFDWGLDSVGAAGFEAAAVADRSDPNYVCVADLEAGVGVAEVGEQCGPVDSEIIQAELAAAAGDDGAGETAMAVTEQYERVFAYPFIDGFDLGEYEQEYYDSAGMWTDPRLRWQMTGDRTDSTWLMIDNSGDEPSLTELTPPEGAVMPVLSYVLPRTSRPG